MTYMLKALALVTALVAGPAVADTTVYSCKGPQGTMSFSQTPCARETTAVGVKTLIARGGAVGGQGRAAPTDASQGVPRTYANGAGEKARARTPIAPS